MKALDYALLREIQKKETDSTKITPLEGDFYEKASEFISSKKDEAFSSGSTLSIREYENIKKILTTIKERREEKIVLMAIRGEGTSTGLTPEEKKLLRELSGAVNDFRETVSGLLSPVENGKEEKKSLKTVRILKDIESYKGLDSRVYGPFKSGEEVELPDAEAEWLLKAKMAENR